MLDFCRLNLILILLFYSNVQSSENYIYQELDGSINDNEGIKLSLFIRNFTGIVIYAVNKNMKSLIELEKEHNKTFVIFKINKFSVKKKTKELCGCSHCSNIYVTFEMIPSQSQATIQCNKLTHSVKIDNEQTLDQFSNYPIPKNYTNQVNKTLIWMGNIGLKSNYHKWIYPLKNQLTGCLDKLYFNGKSKNINDTSIYFFNQCLIYYNDSICNLTQCSTKLVEQSMFDCSITSMNMKHCQNEQFEYSSQPHSFMRINENLNESSIMWRLDWKLRYLNRSVNYCLMELQMRNNVSILFLFTHNSDVLMIIYENGTNTFNRVMVSQVSMNNTNILSVQFDNFHLITKVSNATEVVTYMTSLSEEPRLINIGFAQYKNICSLFEGSINFRYKPTRWRSVNENGFNTLAYILLGLDAIILTLSFLTILYSVKFNCSRSVTNHFDLPFTLTNDYDMESEDYKNLHASPLECVADIDGSHHEENISTRESLIYNVIVNEN